jgi:hypothetical protein
MFSSQETFSDRASLKASVAQLVSRAILLYRLAECDTRRSESRLIMALLVTSNDTWGTGKQRCWACTTCSASAIPSTAERFTLSLASSCRERSLTGGDRLDVGRCNHASWPIRCKPVPRKTQLKQKRLSLTSRPFGTEVLRKIKPAPRSRVLMTTATWRCNQAIRG